MSKTSGVKYGVESKQAPVIHRGPVYRKEDFQPLVNVYFTNKTNGQEVRVNLRDEISSWLERLTPDEVNNIIRDSLEMWRPTQ